MLLEVMTRRREKGWIGKGGDGEDWNRDRQMVNDACMQMVEDLICISLAAPSGG